MNLSDAINETNEELGVKVDNTWMITVNWLYRILPYDLNLNLNKDDYIEIYKYYIDNCGCYRRVGVFKTI